MIDVIHHTIAVTNIDKHFQHINNVIRTQHTIARIFRTTKSAVKFHAAHSGQIIAIRIEKQILE